MNGKSIIALFSISLFMVSTAAYAQPAREEALEAVSRYEAQLDAVEVLNVTYAFETRYHALPLAVARKRKFDDSFFNRGFWVYSTPLSTNDNLYYGHVKQQVKSLMLGHQDAYRVEYLFTSGFTEMCWRDHTNSFITRQIVKNGKATRTVSRILPNGIISTEPERTVDVSPGKKWMLIGAFTWLDHVFELKESDPQITDASNGQVTFVYQTSNDNGIGIDEHRFTFFQKEGHFLPLRHISNRSGVVQEQEFTNYREINGVYVPEKIVSRFRDSEHGETPANFKPYDITMTLVE